VEKRQERLWGMRKRREKAHAAWGEGGDEKMGRRGLKTGEVREEIRQNKRGKDGANKKPGHEQKKERI